MAVTVRTGGPRGALAPGFVLVVVGAALWGTDALFRRGLALALPASTVVLGEHAILVAVTLPWLVRGLRVARRSFGWRDWVALAVVGAGASAGATIAFTAALSAGDPTTPLLLQKLQPVFAMAGARAVLGERLAPRYGLFAVAALAAAWLVGFPHPLDVSLTAERGAAYAVLAAALWGLGTVFGRQLTPKVSTGELTALRFGVGLPAAFVLTAAGGHLGAFGSVHGEQWGALVGLALVPSLAALLIYYRGLRTTPAAIATLGEIAFPVTALIVGYVAFGSALTATQWVGTALLVATVSVMAVVASAHRDDADGALGVTPAATLLATGRDGRAAECEALEKP